MCPLTETSKKRNAARRVNLTKAVIEALKPEPSGFYVINDSKQVGLCVRVMPSGSKFFVAYRKVDGRPQRMTIGRFPEVTVDVARKQVLKLAGEIAIGKNPFAERTSSKKELTLGELHRRFVDEHSKPHKRTWKDDEGLFARYLTGWKNRKLASITRAEIQKRHQQIGQTAPIGANRMLALVSKMFSFAESVGVWNGTNPAKGIQKFREKSRDRFLQPDEMPKFWSALDEEPNDVARDYLKLSLLLGARRANMLAMRWEQLSFDRAEWRIPETKNGDALTVHLPTAALELLKARKQASSSAEWVFPGIGKTGHLVEPKSVWKRVLERAGLADLRIHDLRRTLGSWQAAAGVSLNVIGKSLGHRNTATTAIYARLNLDPVRTAVDTAVEAMLRASGTANGPSDASGADAIRSVRVAPSSPASQDGDG